MNVRELRERLDKAEPNSDVWVEVDGIPLMIEVVDIYVGGFGPPQVHIVPKK